MSPLQDAINVIYSPRTIIYIFLRVAMIRDITSAIRFAVTVPLLAVLAGCGTNETYQPPQPPPTPLQACLKEVNDNHRMCITRGFFSELGSHGPRTASERCEDRKLAQEDRCHARHKQR